MDTLVGKVTHYYSHLGVAVVELSADLAVGDRILILGRTTEFSQPVTSMEIEHRKVSQVGPGMEVALKVDDIVRRGDQVYKVVEGAG